VFSFKKNEWMNNGFPCNYRIYVRWLFVTKSVFERYYAEIQGREEKKLASIVLKKVSKMDRNYLKKNDLKCCSAHYRSQAQGSA
jgi:hypothetical protein